MKAIKLVDIDSSSKPIDPTNAKRHKVPDIFVGKDVLELVSSAMYIDPMTIYREYIQNAADAVEAAHISGTLAEAEQGRVEISVDASSRTVKIRDNGCGIPFEDFGFRLTALGGSTKRGLPARGFRGVGRLAGLAYTQELIFRSRVAGESYVSQLKWDCRELKRKLGNSSDQIGLADLVSKVTTLERVKLENVPERFFEVEMRGVIRLSDDRLVSPIAISNYLSQIAPVPFSPEFRFGKELSHSLSKHVNLGELEIRINGTQEPIYRPHRDTIDVSAKSVLQYNSLELFELASLDEGMAAVAWVLHHDYEGALSAGTLVKGLRIRSGNIQIGDHKVLDSLFPEPRFNSWSVGEVHIIDKRIVPNARRDQFEQNIHFHNLINQLTPSARNIAKRCRTSSVRRKKWRDFELCVRNSEETIGIISQASVSKLNRNQLALTVEQSLLKMRNIANHDLLSDKAAELESTLEALRKNLQDSMNDDLTSSSPLSRLPEDKRKVYEYFFEMIYECSANKAVAKSLIDRIILKLK